MKILCVIDQFGSGGAQRQIVSLGLGLVSKGHEVEFFNYYPELSFFRHEVDQVGITVHDCPKNKKGFSLKVLVALRKLVKTNSYDVALAFLDTPSIYLLLAGLGNKTKLIVSDRSSFLRQNSFSLGIKRQLYRLADYVVTNSFAQRDWLIKYAKLPKKKVVAIYNGYNSDRFSFSPSIPLDVKELKILGIGRISREKNIENLIYALDLLYLKHDWLPKLSWVGRTNSPDYIEKIYKLLDNKPHVKNIWSWLGQRNDIPRLLADHDALILPSLYEGLPNVICEAMLSGKPVLASNVCDNPQLVPEGARGFLFDPISPHSISMAIERLLAMSPNQWEIMCATNRKYAIENLSINKMVAAYERLFEDLSRKNSLPVRRG